MCIPSRTLPGRENFLLRSTLSLWSEPLLCIRAIFRAFVFEGDKAGEADKGVLPEEVGGRFIGCPDSESSAASPSEGSPSDLAAALMSFLRSL